MRRHWTARLRDGLRFPHKLTGGGFDAETEAMLTEATKIMEEAGGATPLKGNRRV